MPIMVENSVQKTGFQHFELMAKHPIENKQKQKRSTTHTKKTAAKTTAAKKIFSIASNTHTQHRFICMQHRILNANKLIQCI